VTDVSHGALSRYQSTVFARPLSNVSDGVQPISLRIFVGSIA
jgi:hypothetical protein